VEESRWWWFFFCKILLLDLLRLEVLSPQVTLSAHEWHAVTELYSQCLTCYQYSQLCSWYGVMERVFLWYPGAMCYCREERRCVPSLASTSEICFPIHFRHISHQYLVTRGSPVRLTCSNGICRKSFPSPMMDWQSQLTDPRSLPKFHCTFPVNGNPSNRRFDQSTVPQMTEYSKCKLTIATAHAYWRCYKFIHVGQTFL
jgi:hypothetical protein